MLGTRRMLALMAIPALAASVAMAPAASAQSPSPQVRGMLAGHGRGGRGRLWGHRRLCQSWRDASTAASAVTPT